MKPGVLLLALGVLLGSNRAFSQNGEAPNQILTLAMQATARGAFDEAIDRLELLADRGFVHPDASYARAYAYVQRARSRAGRPGDLGRAVAALEESRLLRPDDNEVESALETLRSELSRRRSREGSSPMLQRPTIGRAVAALLPENVWAIAGILGSTLVTAGLILYLAVKRRTSEIAGATSIAVGLLFGALGGGLSLLSHYYRTTSHPAVVVVPEARLLDDAGRPLPVRRQDPEGIAEGALVYVHEQREGRSQVEWGTIRGWVQSAQLRPLMTEPSTDRW